MLRVIEYFAKSLEVIQNDILEYGVYKSLLVFHGNDVCRPIFYRFCVNRSAKWTDGRTGQPECIVILWLSNG